MTCKNNLGLTRRNVFHDQDLVYTSEEFCFSGMIFSYAIASWFTKKANGKKKRANEATKLYYFKPSHLLPSFIEYTGNVK